MANPLLDALSYIVDSLDKPGRAIRGGLAGRPDELAAIIPFSDSLRLTDPSRAVSGRDLLEQSGFATGNSTLDDVLGFGVETALDPTTLIGAGIGNRLGRAGGRALEKAAMARGPGFATTAGDLLAQVPGLKTLDQAPARWRIEAIQKANPAAFSEIPEGSQLLKAGAEGLAARTPAGDVVRVGMMAPNTPGRAISEDVLQATRAADYPVFDKPSLGEGFRQFVRGKTPTPVSQVERQTVRAERVPFAQHVGDEAYWLEKDFARPQTDAVGRHFPDRIDDLAGRMESGGLDFWDKKPDNVGVFNGRDVVIDPGAVYAMENFAGGFQPVTRAGAPSALTRALLDLLGGRPAMRRALDAGLASPDFATSLGRAGAVAGGSLGSF